MIPPELTQEIRKEIKRVLSGDVLQKKINDNPRENWDLVNLQYFNANKASVAEGRVYSPYLGSIPINQSGVPQNLNFQTTDFIAGMTYTGTQYFTISTAGKYLVALMVQYGSTPQAGVDYYAIIKNNGTETSRGIAQAGGTANEPAALVVDVLNCAVNDQVSFFGMSSSNSTIPIASSKSVTYASICKV